MDGITTLVSYETVNFPVQRASFKFLLLILMIIMFAIMLSLLINNLSKKYFEDATVLLRKQIENQLRHYEALDEMKKEFHSFRHDYMNHMNCVSALICANKNEEAIRYINKLSDSKIISERPYESGNNILDSILAEKSEIAKESGAEIILDGLFVSDFDPVDLCVIFSNALDKRH